MSIIVVEWVCRNRLYNLENHFKNMKIKKPSKQLLGKWLNEPLTSRFCGFEIVRKKV